MKLCVFAVCFLIAVPLIGRALDQELGRAGVLEEGDPKADASVSPAAIGDPASPSSSTSAGGIGTALIVENATYQGKSIRWWARRAVQNGKDSRARGRTIRRLQAAARRQLTYPTGHWLDGAFLCIHRYERGAAGWRTLTGNGYHGGLQMNAGFQRTYGPEWARKAFGESAHLWPASVQITAAIRAWTTRGFGPWPMTRKSCGL